MHTFDLNVGEISKMEGKASLTVRVKNDRLETVQFKITEFKRFYTQAIRGKDLVALPQLTARICGTCSNAHLLCAIKAVEKALDINPTLQTVLLRRLLNFGLLIRDHALHLYVFAMPDILGIDNILELDENKPDQHQLLDDTFSVKAAGNALGKAVGGRSVHAPYPTVGGFIKLPDQAAFPGLIKQLTEIRPRVLRLIKIFQDCDFKLIRNIDFTTLMDAEYSFLDGNIITKSEMAINTGDLGNYLDHTVIPYSQASGYKFMGRVYMVGALARVNLAKDKLHSDTQRDAKDALKLFPSDNIYHNNLAQAVEILHSIDSSIEILKKLNITDEKPVPFVRREGTGVGVIEAPRGTLFYKISLNAKGQVEKGEIVVPTGQNQIGIEKSITDYILSNLEKSRDEQINEIEKIVRAYDPCMSCASHFLKVKWYESD